jgi:formylglycine-generating enzyme required for sulfatase activity
MVALPGGRVTMGGGVAIQPFALARTEITRGEFARFVAATGRPMAKGCWYWAVVWLNDAARDWKAPGFAQTDAHPAVCVSWRDAAAYADWLSARSGKRFRLPTEAEWQYASGGDGALPWGANEAQACRFDNLHDASGYKTYGNFAVSHFDCDDGAPATAPVGSYLANRFGLQDMLGNAWEWTADCWNAGHGGRPASGAARQDGDCAVRVQKGGNFTHDKSAFAPAYRHPSARDVGNIYGGFRLARDLN